MTSGAPAAIKGVLLEGVDFVGKTTTAAELARLLEDDGILVTSGRCYLRRGPLIEFLEEKAQALDDMFGRDGYYTAALLLDLELYDGRDDGAFVVQDRHWLTQLGRNSFFHPHAGLMPDGFLERRHLPFEINFLLTCTLDAKLQRSRSRPPRSPRDRLLAAHPRMAQDYEDFLRTLLPGEEDWRVLDTTDLSPRETAEEIRAQIVSAGVLAPAGVV